VESQQPQSQDDAMAQGNGPATLALAWQRLAAAWTVEDARAFAETLEALLDDADDARAARAGDLAAYLAVFADGALMPSRAQLARLDDCAPVSAARSASTATPRATSPNPRRCSTTCAAPGPGCCCSMRRACACCRACWRRSARPRRARRWARR